MITGNIRDAYRYFSVHRDFKKAFEILSGLTVSIENGSHKIDGLTVNVSNPKKNDEKPFEAHRKYIDLHFIIEGEEDFGYANINYASPTTEYNGADDYLLLEGEKGRTRLKTGDFCITFPEDAHAPALVGGEGESVKRAVVKILV
jgi:YhcH/YjgK/YiaL family protein